MSSASARWLEVLGRRLFVRRWGEPGALSLHGFTGVGSDVLPFARRLRVGVCAPDLLGHGRSEAPRPEGAGGFAPYALGAQGLGVIALAREVGARVLVGYSYGGRLALTALLQAPEVFSAAILVGATPGLADRAERDARARADDERARRIEELGAPAFLERWQATPLIRTQARIAAPDRERMARERRAHTADGLAGALRGAGTGRQAPLWERLSQLTLPILLLTGEEDSKFCAIAQGMLERLPRAAHVQVAGAGHCAHLEQPELAAAAANAFLEQHGLC